MGLLVTGVARGLACVFLLAMALAAADGPMTSGDSDISCKYLLGAMASALVGTNAFWALWMRTVLKEKDAVTDARISDLQAAASKVRSKDKAHSDT